MRDATGGSNTGVGDHAGLYSTPITTGTNNIMIGALTYPSAGDAVKQIVLGTAQPGVGNNIFSFGHGSTNRVYNNFSSNASWTRSSDRRLKKDIQTNTDCGLNFINDLRTVTFKWKAPSEIEENLRELTNQNDATAPDYTPKMYGFIAQEVKSVLDNHNITDFNGWHQTKAEQGAVQGISYEMFVMPLVKAIQELSAKNDSLETSNQALIARIEALENA